MTAPRIFPCTDNLTREDFRNGVYDPDSDSFCLMDAIEKDWETIRKNGIPHVIFDFGSGSGILSAHFRMLLDTIERTNHMSVFYCLDINPYATRASLNTLRHNPVTANCPAEALCCDVSRVESLKRFYGMADIILWNPPYVPSVDDPSGDYACAGGTDGTAFIRQMFPTAVRLLSSSGYLYVLLIEQNNPSKIAEF
eukprot:CAMPEP_0201538798 /NCGR_PEP_ID=MMETSP0161_2-20130828/68626_1 /ASSEMBLY_ACC=CAM_ASM_000251 /TAXON_ID=180227 /ORGANISM="Neoparamoeba aestuarina, Strain SoJaBio B1-5/56/2" /LENGTH=195 /DNA_ID=CAMNT_0047945847 /DNA_START=75 /DNA_END=659 /DNA_ORIENTATION=+